MTVKKKDFFSDPTGADMRKQSMLSTVELDLEDELLAMPGVNGHGHTKVRKRQVTEKGAKSNADWAVLMVKVRDARDEAAFIALFNHFAPRIKAFLMKSGAEATMAEDCAQDVMTTVWRKAHLFDPARASVATWIFTIARNRRIDLLRKERRPEAEDLTWGPEAEPDQADALALQQECDALGQAMAALPETQRALIEKAYFGDLSHSEIASVTGLPLGTIKSRIRLALNRLRQSMK